MVTASRRDVLRWTGLAAGVTGGLLPLLDAGPAGAGTDPDRLFQAGWFEAADRGYAAVLRTDPADAQAVAQRGRIALLSNRFGAAEEFLTRALELAPGELLARQQLADCYVRQDRFDLAARLVSPGGVLAAQYAAMTGPPYAMSGAQATRLPFLGLDPLPHVQASLPGLAPATFLLDTGATFFLSQQAADRAGLPVLASTSGNIGGENVALHHGVVPAFRLGGIELRDVPVSWADLALPRLPDGSEPAGTIGTTILYHFLATMDYAGRALVLRRRTAAQRRAFEAAVRRSGAQRLPLWLADHFPCTLASLNDYGPRVASLDTGGVAAGVNTSVDNAERAGIAIDHDHPAPGPTYPIVADRVSIGRAVRRRVRGTAGPSGIDPILGFGTIANVTHEFFTPYAITFDFTGMTFTIEDPRHSMT
jgi:tetratricopeptide (TPR) repeat protein